MKKTLVFHLYVGEDIETNKAYKIHKGCLTYYRNIFDKVKFIIALDDLGNKYLRGKGFDFINSIGYDCEVTIDVIQNTNLYEVETLKREILNTKNQNGEGIFFAHVKGVKNFREFEYTDSIENWIYTMYFYNLNYIDYVEELFVGKNGHVEVMFGTLLMETEERDPLLFLSKYHFSGTFYWFNNQFYKNLIKYNKIDEFIPCNRMDGEMMPGILFEREYYGYGIRTMNDVCFNLLDYPNSFYILTEEQWDNVHSILGDMDLFNNFRNNMKNILA